MHADPGLPKVSITVPTHLWCDQSSHCVITLQPKKKIETEFADPADQVRTSAHAIGTLEGKDSAPHVMPPPLLNSLLRHVAVKTC